MLLITLLPHYISKEDSLRIPHNELPYLNIIDLFFHLLSINII